MAKEDAEIIFEACKDIIKKNIEIKCQDYDLPFMKKKYFYEDEKIIGLLIYFDENKTRWILEGHYLGKDKYIFLKNWRGLFRDKNINLWKATVQKVNKKMKTKALYTLLSRKFRDGLVVLVDELDLKTPKTKTAATALQALAKSTKAETLAYKTGKRTLVLTPSMSEGVKKSFRNLPSALAIPASELNLLNLLTYKHLVIINPDETITKLKSRSVKSAK